MAGLAVFERECFFLAQSLDRLQAQFFPNENDPVEFHASALRIQREEDLQPPFNSLTREQRRELGNAIYSVIAESRAQVFAVSMEKAAVTHDPYGRGFEEVVNRFDRMLGNIYRDRGEQQRGLVVIAESSYRENLETLARNIWSKGHRWGELHNQADIPYFAPARSTRLLQLADFVANAVYARYQHGISRDLDRISPRIYQEAGRLHGLVHITLDRLSCYCPACVARRALPPPIRTTEAILTEESLDEV